MSSGPAGPSLAEVLPSAFSALGVEDSVDSLGLAPYLAGVRRIAVLLVDGLGHRLLPLAAPHAPLLADVLGGSAGYLAELSCSFPSTTPTSLVTLATGVLPGAHGVLGFTVNVPGTDRVLSHIRWRDDPDPHQWQPVPTMFERAARAGVASAVVLPKDFAGSGLTVAAYRGARFCGLDRHADLVSGMLGELRATPPGEPALVYGYTAAVDTAAHVHGIASAQWAAAVAATDTLLHRLVAGLSSDTALVVTADHGGLDVPMDRRVDLATAPHLAESIRVLAGEPRVRYLHTMPGTTEDVVAAWRATLGERATVVTRAQAVDEGWFGPVTPSHRDRIGDVVVICTGDGAILDTVREPREVARLVGMHGGPTRAELAVPLIVLRATSGG